MLAHQFLAGRIVDYRKRRLSLNMMNHITLTLTIQGVCCLTNRSMKHGFAKYFIVVCIVAITSLVVNRTKYKYII